MNCLRHLVLQFDSWSEARIHDALASIHGEANSFLKEGNNVNI